MAVAAIAMAAPAQAATEVPGSPKNLRASAGNGVVNLSWGVSRGEVAGYQVWRSRSGGTWVRVAKTSPTTLTYADHDVENRVQYTYGIRAYNDFGASSSSNLDSATPSACVPGGSIYSGLISSTPGLAGYWRLNEPRGTGACDLSGGNDGSYRYGVTLARRGAIAGDQDFATGFDGSTGHVRVPDTPALAVGDSFTVEAWVRRGSTGGTTNQVIAAKQTGSWVLMFDPRNRLVLRQSNVGDVATSRVSVTDTSRWHHVVATKAGPSVHLYVDGADVTGTVAGLTMLDNTRPLLIGQSSGTAFFGGTIDEVALYAGALTPAQVTRHYRAGVDPVIAGAGDTACSPTAAAYNGGLGTATDCRQQYTSDLLVDANLAAVLPLGDNQYDTGALAEYSQAYDQSWGRVKAISHPVPGNHEYDSDPATGYFDYFNGPGAATGPAGPRGKGYYSYDIGGWHMIALNSECGPVGGCGPGSAQELWLRADLAAHPAPCTLAYWHRPLFSSGFAGNATETRQLWQDLYDAGAEVVLTGHSHSYERFAPQDANGALDPARGIREFVAGTGGEDHHALGTLKPNSEAVNATTFGVLKLQLHAGGYDWQFVPEAGRSYTDSGSGDCH